MRPSCLFFQRDRAEMVPSWVFFLRFDRLFIQSFFPECVAKGSRLTLGGLGVELCSRPVASMFATVGNRPQ